ncbi:hypothetical protein [Acinetobacter baumannii]|uniref:hypothetical protein n=1 Tax=Acinetobacter baumannii TaxID=470 RepID=UPI003989D769
MAAATQNTDETLASTDDQTTIKQKATRSKTNKTTEAQNTQTGDDKSSDQGDLLNSQGPENGATQKEVEQLTDLKNGDSDNEDSSTKDDGNSTESSNKTQQTDIPKAEHQIVENLAGSSISSLDSLVIHVTNNGFSTVLEPLSRVAIEAGKTASITCHNQTFKHQVLENLRQLKGLGKNLTVE